MIKKVRKTNVWNRIKVLNGNRLSSLQTISTCSLFSSFFMFWLEQSSDRRNLLPEDWRKKKWERTSRKKERKKERKWSKVGKKKDAKFIYIRNGRIRNKQIDK